MKKKILIVNFNNISCEGNTNKTILDIVLEAGECIKYSCGAGQCKQCAFQLISGEVCFEGNPKTGYLACKSYPLSDLVILQQ